MAVKDERIYHPTESLILQNPRRHYRTSIHAEHWQLRSQIGTEKSDAVYFPSGSGNLQVQRLNLTTRESETIRLLSFTPRCLVAKNGWVSCGGETGEFTAFCVNGTNEPSDLDLRLELDADERLRLSLGPITGDESGTSLFSRARAANKSIVAPSKKFGKERVNCITLWFPPNPEDGRDTQYNGAYSQPVAVLANNDKNVTVVSLEDQESIDELSYPDCVNRALLSPDGRFLVALCDDPYLYVHERVAKPSDGGTLFRHKDTADFEWRSCAKIHLKSQRKDDRTDARGSFAACFSNTGRYLAVGTQYGTISIFNTAAIPECSGDSLVTTFTSTRPKQDTGAIRDMAFCPGPFDLLAWTEHRGRVSVADIRSNYISRQTLDLNHYDDYDHVITADRGPIDPQLLLGGDRSETLASTLASNLDLSVGDSDSIRRSTRRLANDLDRYRYPLTADETMVLEALQEHRRHREQVLAAASSTATPGSSRWAERRSGEGASGSTRTGATTDASRASRERSSSTSRYVSDLLGNLQSQRDRTQTQSERFRARRLYEESGRMGLHPHPPPRRSQVLFRGADNDRENIISRVYGLSSSSSGGGAGGASGGWADIEALANISFDGSGSPYEPGAGESTGNRTRDRMAYFGSLLSGGSPRDWDDMPLRRTTHGRSSPRSNEPDDTTGLAWSEDGRVLFVGAENGIYEFHVNVVGRKLFPSITLR